MILAEIRIPLKANGDKTTVKVDRFDEKRQHGDVVVGVMFTDGTVAYLGAT